MRNKEKKIIKYKSLKTTCCLPQSARHCGDKSELLCRRLTWRAELSAPPEPGEASSEPVRSLKGFFPFLRRFSHSQEAIPGLPAVPAAFPARSPCLSFPRRGAAGGLPALTLLAACGLQRQEEPEGDEPQGRHGAGLRCGDLRCGDLRSGPCSPGKSRAAPCALPPAGMSRVNYQTH